MAATAALPDAPEVDTQPEDFGPKNRDLPDQLKQAILTATREAQGQEKYVRRQEILQDSQNRFYDMGIQHICYQNQFNGYVQAAPGGTYFDATGSTQAFGTYIDDYNIFGPFALIQQAKLSENMPGIDFQPIDPNVPADIESANAAEGMRHEFDRNNNIKEIQRSFTYHLQMGGRAVTWTRGEDSAEKYSDGSPRRRKTATVYGTIEAKVPIFAGARKDFWYTLIYDDPDIKTAKTNYPWVADKLAAGQVCLSENAWERIARLGIIQGSQGARVGFRIGDSISHLISQANVWLRLSAFQAMKDAYNNPDGEQETVTSEDGTERSKEVREKLAEVFPDGVHALVVGDQFVEAESQSMDDCISIKHAYVGKGQSRKPIMRDMLVVQDRFNSTMNHSAEEFDYNCSETWISCQPAEYAALKKQKSAPGSMRYLKSLPAGASIDNYVKRLQGGDLPKSFQDYIEFLYGALPQFQLAVPPSIWGASMKDQKTAAGYQLAASQAMGVLGVFWAAQTEMLADMYYHNCLAIMNDPDYPDQISIPAQNGQTVSVRKESLTKGNFRAFPDTESGFPESTSQKRATLTQVTTQLANSPLAAQIFGSPDNVAAMLREYGMPELVIPEAESRNKQLREIEELLAGSPKLDPALVQILNDGGSIPDVIVAIKQVAAQANQQAMVKHAADVMVAQVKGQGAPPAPPPVDPSTLARSSVPVWESDYHVWEAKKCRDWLSSTERYNEETIGRASADQGGQLVPNLRGILNVFLHMKEHDAFAAQQAAPVSGPLPAPTMQAAQLQPPPAPPVASAGMGV